MFDWVHTLYIYFFLNFAFFNILPYNLTMKYLFFFFIVTLSFLLDTSYFIMMFYLDLFFVGAICVVDAYTFITSFVKISLHPLNFLYAFLYIKTKNEKLKEGYIIFLEIVYWLSCRRFFIKFKK